MYNYQKSNRYFAQVADDIKDIAGEELLSLGAENLSTAYRGIYFEATPQIMYSVNYNSRLINRVLAPLLSFECHSDNYLYKTALKIEWKDFLSNDDTFAVFSSVSHSAITHSKFAALRLKDAIVDYFRDSTGNRPSVETINPDVWINLHIENNQAVISLDTSGGSLHRRGYRKKTIKAPMSETLAAALIKYSDWEGSQPLYDPFCGSGTILCEGFMYATHMPPAYFRRNFGFKHLPDYDEAAWEEVRIRSNSKSVEISKGIIAGSDKLFSAVNSALGNFSLLDPQKCVSIIQKNIFEIDSLNDAVIICNPPYGIRLNKRDNLDRFYKDLGDFMKQKCKGSTAFIYFGEREYIKKIGLKSTWKRPLNNGGLDGRLVRYDLY